MPVTTETYQELWQLFYHPASLEEVLAGYHRVVQLRQEEKLDEKEASELKARAFQVMQDAAVDNPEASSAPILDLLLPECLRREPDDSSELKFSRSRYRERLGAWLDALTEPTRSKLRSEVLARLRNSPTLLSRIWRVTRSASSVSETTRSWTRSGQSRKDSTPSMGTSLLPCSAQLVSRNHKDHGSSPLCASGQANAAIWTSLGR